MPAKSAKKTGAATSKGTQAIEKMLDEEHTRIQASKEAETAQAEENERREKALAPFATKMFQNEDKETEKAKELIDEAKKLTLEEMEREKTVRIVDEEGLPHSCLYESSQDTTTPPNELTISPDEQASTLLSNINTARKNGNPEKLLRISQSLPDECVNTQVYAELIRAIGLTNVNEVMAIYHKAKTKGIVDTLILSTAIEMLIRTGQMRTAIDLYNYGDNQGLLDEDTCFRVMSAIATHCGIEEAGLFYAESIPPAIHATSSRIHETILSMVFNERDKANAHLLTLANVAHTNLMATNLPINYDAVHARMFQIALAYNRLFTYTDAIYRVVREAPGGIIGPLTYKAYQDCLAERANIKKRPQLAQTMNYLYDRQDDKREAKKAFIERIRSQPSTQQPSRNFLQYLSGAQQTRPSVGRGRGH